GRPASAHGGRPPASNGTGAGPESGKDQDAEAANQGGGPPDRSTGAAGAMPRADSSGEKGGAATKARVT
ncbi:hypothetical protein C3R26_21085, partial [Mycobacterium tuberculosis]